MATNQKNQKKATVSQRENSAKANDHLPGHEHVARWLAPAGALDKGLIRAPNVPVTVYLQEAAGAAHFVEQYWEPAADGTRPSLQAVSNVLSREVASEIRSLIEACRNLHTRVLIRGDGNGATRAQLDRAMVVASELSSALEFVLDDGVSEASDEALRAAKERLAEDGSRAQLAQTLVDYATIAVQVREQLSNLGDFDLAMIEEAPALATALIARGTPAGGGSASEDIALRERMLHLLAERVNAVRRAARYVFRNHPDIARRVTSAYERRRRLAYKRRVDGDAAGQASDSASAVSPASPTVAASGA